VPAKKLLLVEDEKDMSFILSSIFRKEGYEFLTAATAEAGLKLARKHKPDLVISDVMLPKMDGLEMLRALRLESRVPVLFLTGRRNEADRIRGFELGADDYLTKPFSMRELVARVKTLLRRAARAPAAPSGDGIVKIGGIQIDFVRHEVRIHGKYRHLTPREFLLLKLLVEADGKVLSREKLLRTLWGVDGDAGVNTRTVDQHVARLRRSLGGEKRRIVTVKNAGYRLTLGK
jgi:DNA-binding response OmpR family regulator